MTTSAIEVRPSARRALKRVKLAFLARLTLPPKLSLTQWADQYRIIPPPAAEAGPWRTDRVPYMREIMDTISGHDYQDITVLKCSQSSGTEGCINNAVGYYIDQEPSSILVIQPNVKPMAEGWSKERLAPMLSATPKLRGKVKDPRSRDSRNTVLMKSFAGGFLVVVGANSPAGLASWPIRVVLADELDRWPDSAGTEGDPLSLAEARQITYRHRKKTVKVTTPGNAGESRGEKEWAASDQRHFYVPCPHCGHEQPLEWRDSKGKPDIRNGRGDYRLVWEKEVEGEEVRHKPETARYVCRECGVLIEEIHKPAMLAKGRWVKHNPASKRAGFHISGLLSPWVRWRDIAADWLRKKDDPEQRQTFFNTKLGLLYETEGDVPDADQLSHRRETYGAEVPDGVGLLTCSVDVQGDRLEVEVRGWGAREESWQILLERLHGDPEEDPQVWEDAEAVINRRFTDRHGQVYAIRAGCVDSGFATDTVYQWVRPRQRRRIYATKGVDGLKHPISKASRANKDGVKVYSYNPVKLKDVLFARLKKQRPGPGYLHFGPEEQTGADDAYFLQFGAEKRLVDWHGHKPVVKYVAVKPRNEAIDLYVMNLVALRSLGSTVRKGLDSGRRTGAKPEGTAREVEAQPAESPVNPVTIRRNRLPRKPRGFVSNW